MMKQPEKLVSSDAIFLAAVFLSLSFLAGCLCHQTKDFNHNSDDLVAAALANPLFSPLSTFKIDHPEATKDLNELTTQPHIFGSERQTVLSAYLSERARTYASSVQKLEFTSDVPNPAATTSGGPVEDRLKRNGINIIASAGLTSKPKCFVLIGSHYDTKNVSGARYVGANDSGSSSVALLQALAALKKISASLGGENSISKHFRCDIAALWFDGEEAQLQEWTDGEFIHPAHLQDNTYGSRNLASQLTPCDKKDLKNCFPNTPPFGTFAGLPIAGLVLLDMIGSPAIQLSRDSNSTASLLETAERLTDALKLSPLFTSGAPAQGIEDDHIPFIRQNIPAIDLIDFNHLQFWHRPGDEADTIDYQSIEKATKLGLALAISLAATP